MFIKDLQDHLGPSDYAALRSIHGFNGLDPYMKIAGLTKNGNYHILYLPDGSKLRFTSEDSLEPERPECIDCTITKRCDGGCKFCYMGCTPQGKHASLKEGRIKELLDQIEPYTELAINGNDLSHPDLDWFLRYMAGRNVFVNITVNQQHYIKYYTRLLNWKAHAMIRGIGVSYTGQNYPGLINKFHALDPFVVIHVIAGVITKEEWEFLANNDLTVLVLGYKDISRGKEYLSKHREVIQKRTEYLEKSLRSIAAYRANDSMFKTILFDGLAVDQLHVRDWLPKVAFDAAYAGGEGSYTFYLNLVSETFARSSVDVETPWKNMSIQEMFKSIQTEPLRKEIGEITWTKPH